MTAPAVHLYEASAAASEGGPSRYEWELEGERARVLRRRFMWFTGTLGVLTLVTLWPASWAGFEGAQPPWWVVALSLVVGVVQISALAWAFLYARRQVRHEHRLYLLAFWLVVGLGLSSLVAARVAIVEGTKAGYEVGARGLAAEARASPGDADLAARAARAPAAAPRVLVGAMALVSLWWAVFVTHFVACLFLPWKVPEAWRPAQWLLLAAALILLVDVASGTTTPLLTLLGVALMPTGVLPGIGWCWWRHSAFRRRYRLTFVNSEMVRLEHDLEGARRVHDSVLPRAVREGPVCFDYAYEPARQIGGDLVYVFPPEPREGVAMHVVVLDVAGHGIAAALAVNRLAGELERLFCEACDLPPEAVLSSLNRYVYLTLSRHAAFVTGFVVRLDPDGERPLTVAGAGHPDVFLWDDARRHLRRLPSRSMMLGVLPPDAFTASAESYAFDAGDALVLYTDGAAEARDRDGRQVGFDGVYGLVSDAASAVRDPCDWPEAVLRRVASHRYGPAEDDTLIAALCRPPAAAG